MDDTTTTITVRGTATREVEADHAVVHFSAAHLGKTREQAMAAVDAVAEALRSTLDALRGVDPVVVPGVRCLAEYDHSGREPRLRGYRAMVSGWARSTPDAVGAVAEAVAACRADLGWLAWGVEDDHPAHREVRREAVEQARRAAEDFADAVGRPLGALVSLADPGLMDQGPAPMARLAAAPVAAGGVGGPGGAAEVSIDPELVRLHAAVEARYLA